MLNYDKLMKLVVTHPRQIMYYNEKSCGLLSLCKYCLDGRIPDIKELKEKNQK